MSARVSIEANPSLASPSGEGDRKTLRSYVLRSIAPPESYRDRLCEAGLYFACHLPWITPVMMIHFKHVEIESVESAKQPDPSSEEHTSELQSLMRISYAVFCLKKKKKKHQN